MKTCKINNCDEPNKALGWCNKHYMRNKRTGTTGPPGYINHPEPKQGWRLKAIEKLGNKCAICGLQDFRALQIDHIKAIGNKRNLNAKLIYKTIALGHTNGFQVLCANHNWIKRYTENEH